MNHEENKEYFDKIGLVPGEEYKIKLEYFDKNGNYIKTGEYLTKGLWMFNIADEIKSMISLNSLPNIDTNTVNIYVDASEHPNGFPVYFHGIESDISSNRDLSVDIRTESTKNEEYLIRLEYFKSSGKYYTEDEFKTTEINPIKIFNEICNMKTNNKLPGVACGDFTVYINASEHPNGFRKVLFNK